MYKPKDFRTTAGISAMAKATFANDFVNFVESNFARKLFRQDFYDRLKTLRGHDDHGGIDSFYAEWFRKAENKVEFLTIWSKGPISSRNPMADVLTALKRFLVENKWVERQMARNQEK